MSFPRRYRNTATERASSAGDASRPRVLDVALDLFAVSGFRGTSLAQIAERSGLSQSGLLHHFPSKAALLSAAIEHRDDTDSAILEENGRPIMGWAALDALVELAQRNRERPETVRLYVSISAEALDESHPAHAWVIGHYDSVERWLSAALDHGIKVGEIEKNAPITEIVRETVSVMDGLQIQWLVSRQSFDLAQAFSNYVDKLKSQWSVRERQPISTPNTDSSV